MFTLQPCNDSLTTTSKVFYMESPALINILKPFGVCLGSVFLKTLGVVVFFVMKTTYKLSVLSFAL